jgi:hypothetical protein
VSLSEWSGERDTDSNDLTMSSPAVYCCAWFGGLLLSVVELGIQIFEMQLPK